MWDTTKQLPASQPTIQVHIYNINTSPAPTYPAVQPVYQNEGRQIHNFTSNSKSKSFNTGFLIFMSGGMNMAWKLGFAETFNSQFVISEEIISSWFVGGIIGAIIGACLCQYLRNKILKWMSSILIIISGILQVSDPNTYDTILASRYLNGIAVGLVFPMTFVKISEEAVKTVRGVNAALIDTIAFSCGLLTQIIFSASWSNETEEVFEEIRLIGILNIILGIIAFIMAIHVIESPLFYLARGEEQMAIESLIRLQPPHNLVEPFEQLLEHKCYLAESKTRTFMQSAMYGVPALLKLCFYRSFMALGFSYFVNFTFTYSMHLRTDKQIFPYILYAFARLLGTIIASLTLDSRGRKPPIIIGFFICTGFAFAIGGIFMNFQNYSMFDYMAGVKYVLIFFQLFAAMSMASSSAYLCEAFPLAVKSYYIAVVFIVEMLVHIIAISFRDTLHDNHHIYWISYYFLTLGGFSLGFLFVAILVMPETKQCSLRECLIKFRKFFNFRN